MDLLTPARAHTHRMPALATVPRGVAPVARVDGRRPRVGRREVECALECLVHRDLRAAVGRACRRGQHVIDGRVDEREVDRRVRGLRRDVVWAAAGEERDLGVDMSVRVMGRKRLAGIVK